MRYGYGVKCGDGSELRRTAVKLLCGSETAVVAAVEDGNCKYALTVTTPAACFKWPRSSAKQKLKELQGKLKELQTAVAE